MRTFTRMMMFVILALLITGFRATAGPSDFTFTIANDVQTSDRTYEFDLYLLDTDAAQTFELSTVQAGILVNPAIYNGGTITVSIVPASSQLVAAQQPTSVIWTLAQNAIKLTPNSPPPVGQGTILSQTGQGTRVCRLRITNSVAFATNTHANLAFNFTTSPYPTRVSQIIGGINTQLTCNATNCFSNAVNPLFNPPSCPVTTIATVADICPNTAFQVPVKVTNFIQVGSISLTLNYDVAVMDFVSGVNTSNYPSLTINEPTPGVIKIGGFSTNAAGVSMADNSTLFTLNFNYLGGTGAVIFNHTNPSDNEYAGIPPLYTPYNDIPESSFYFDGNVTGDQIAPSITCPANVTLQAAAGSCFILNPALGTPQTSDNCAVNTVTNNFSTLFPTGEVTIGVHTITWTVTDFNNNSSTCSQTLTITQGPDPVFTAIGPYCQHSTAPALPLTSSNGITGTWNPASVNTATAGTFGYTFTPGGAECSNPVTVQITIDPELTPTFGQIGSLCQNTIAPSLPLTSLNGVTGTWNPATISTAVPGTVTYTFTPTAGQCAVQTTMDITIDPLVTPQFNAIGPLCQFTTAPVLPATSLNGVAGTWSPATINTNVAGIFTYTFTPSVPYCTNGATMSIVIDPAATPTFNQIDPLCLNSSAPALPTTSLNSISGTWNPSAISTAIAGTFTFTFTPSASFCAVPVTMSVVVNNPTTPLFTEIGSLCQNSVPPALPTTSNNAIQGTWNPAVINTASTGTTVYTFSPDAAFCATTTTMSITIDTQVTPVFAQIGPLCQNSTAPQLPLTSTNNIIGTWSPATISTSTPGSFVFTFTPEAGSCAISTTMTIVVDPLTTPTFNAMGPYCQNSVADPLPSVSLNNLTGTWSPATINTTAAGTFAYTFTPDDPWCTTTATLNITINPTQVPVFTQIDPLCLNSAAPLLPTVSNNSIPGTWNPAVISTSVAGNFEYVFTPNAATNPCAVSVSMFITVNPLPTATISGSTSTWQGIPVNLTVNLTGTAPWTYYWSDDNGATTHMVNAATTPSVFSVSPSITTTYIITSVDDATGCTNTGSGSATVTINSVTVSGNISYYNTSATAMNGVQVNLSQNSVVLHTATTDASGNYTIPGVYAGTYDVTFVTSKPAGGVNATDAAQLNAWGVGPQYDIEKVRFLSGDVIGPDIINATDASRVLTHFVTSGNPAFATAWTFWNTNDIVTTNAPQSTLLTVTVPTGSTGVTANYYALVTGDFNQSFIPSPAKNTTILTGLTLNHEGIMEVYPNETFMLPITAGMDMEISAISLVLEFPADRLEILGVYLGNDINQPLEYAVIGNQLRIGWQSINHLSALTGDALVTLKVRNLYKIEENETLSFNLYPDTLNELADQNYEVIYGAMLLIDDIKGNTVGTSNIELSQAIAFSGYPNPFSAKLTLNYSIPADGKVTFEVTSIMGNKVLKTNGLNTTAGAYISTLDANTLVAGVYAVTMTFESLNGTVISKTVKMIKKQ